MKQLLIRTTLGIKDYFKTLITIKHKEDKIRKKRKEMLDKMTERREETSRKVKQLQALITHMHLCEKDGRLRFKLGDFVTSELVNEYDMQILACHGKAGAYKSVSSHVASEVVLVSMYGELLVNTDRGKYAVKPFGSINIPRDVSFEIKAVTDTEFIYIAKPPEDIFKIDRSD